MNLKIQKRLTIMTFTTDFELRVLDDFFFWFICFFPLRIQTKLNIGSYMDTGAGPTPAKTQTPLRMFTLTHFTTWLVWPGTTAFHRLRGLLTITLTLRLFDLRHGRPFFSKRAST